MNKLTLFIWLAVCLSSTTANALNYPIYNCNLPCNSIDKYAQIISISETSNNSFIVLKADTGEFGIFETKTSFINTGGYLIEARRKSDSKVSNHFKQYYAGVIATTFLSIQLPVIDPENIYRPMSSLHVLLNEPQQADFIELSLAKNKLVIQHAKFVRGILSENVKHADTIMFRVKAVINDGSVANFKVLALFNNDIPTIELFYLDNSTTLYEDYLNP